MAQPHTAGGGHTLPTSIGPVANAPGVVWRDMHGRKWKPNELEDSHLANIILHITERPGYAKEVFEAMVREADMRGFPQEYIDAAPYPYLDPETGLHMIADYSGGTMTVNPYEEPLDHFVLNIGSKVIGVTLDLEVFGDPVMKDDLPITTMEAKYTAHDVIPWTHDVGNAIMTYWMLQKKDIQVVNDAVLEENRRKMYVLLKVDQDNRYGITHLIVKDDDLPLYDPEAV